MPEILAAAERGELAANGWVLPIESVFAPLPALHVNEGVKDTPAQRLPYQPL